MRVVDVKRCIRAWFDAVFAQTPAALWPRYKSAQLRLFGDLEYYKTVRELAETPLLCALLCAFYAEDETGMPPKSRTDLYDRLISGLIHWREVRSGREQVHGIGLELGDKWRLLQALARDMLEAGAVTIRTHQAGLHEAGTTALDVLAQRQQLMRAGLPPPSSTLEYLLTRSVVFRLIGPGQAQFAHKTLQEYLAARDYVQAGSAQTLLNHLGDRSWDTVLVMVAGLAPQSLSERILRGLLNRCGSFPWSRPDLYLTAAFVGATPILQPRLAEEARRALRPVLPPRNTVEVTRIANLGEEVLSLLHLEPGYSRDERIGCLTAAAVIGGPGALALLRVAAQSNPDKEIQQLLLRAWDGFEAGTFAREVLSHLQLEDLVIPVGSTESLNAVLHDMPETRQIRVEPGIQVADFTGWSRLQSLSALDVGPTANVRSLVGIEALTNLRRLNLSGNSAIRGLSPLGQLTHLAELHLDRCASVADLAALRNLLSLRILTLNGVGARDCTALADLTKLRLLSMLEVAQQDISPLSALTQLRTLRAVPASRQQAVAALSGLERLQELALQLPYSSSDSEPRLLSSGPSNLKKVDLRSNHHLLVADIADLRMHPELRQVRLSSAGGVAEQKAGRLSSAPQCKSLAFLAGNQQLTHLVVHLAGSSRVGRASQ